MVVIGFGQGLALSPFTAAGVANTVPEDAGAASGVVNVMHQIGGSVGLSMLVAVQSSFTNEITGFNNAILVGTALILVSLMFAIFLVLPGEKQSIERK
jgi:sugar phosphate permease